MALFPEKMMIVNEMNINSISGKLLTFIEQFRLIHWQAESYNQHKLTDEFIEHLSNFRDDVIEILISYTGTFPRNYKLGDITVLVTLNDLLLYCRQIKSYAEINKYDALSALIDEMYIKLYKYKYLLNMK